MQKSMDRSYLKGLKLYTLRMEIVRTMGSQVLFPKINSYKVRSEKFTPDSIIHFNSELPQKF